MTVRWPSKFLQSVSHLNLSMFRDFLNLSKEVTEALKTNGFLPETNGSTRTETPSPGSPVAGPSGVGQLDGVEDNERYRLALSPLQYEGMEFASHSFMFEMSSSPTPATIYRIAHEIATISQAESLPCFQSSSIFVRSDDAKMYLLKAVITG